MAEATKQKGVVKFVFWAVCAGVVAFFWVNAYTSGEMVKDYYYTAKTDGYAVNATAFVTATKENPAVLQVGNFESIEGLQAVPVKKGDRLPTHTNGIIEMQVLKEGKRAVLDGETIKILVPSQIKESKGFKYKDTFKHKGIKTNPWAAAWNVMMVFFLGISMGLMAEGFTDILGLKLHKIQHHAGH